MPLPSFPPVGTGAPPSHWGKVRKSPFSRPGGNPCNQTVFALPDRVPSRVNDLYSQLPAPSKKSATSLAGEDKSRRLLEHTILHILFTPLILRLSPYH